MTISTAETWAVGTRTAWQEILPVRCGKILVRAWEALVVVGIMESAAARARRRSR